MRRGCCVNTRSGKFLMDEDNICEECLEGRFLGRIKSEYLKDSMVCFECKKIIENENERNERNYRLVTNVRLGTNRWYCNTCFSNII